MAYSNPKLHILLRELIAGREISNLINDCLRSQLQRVAWHFLEENDNATLIATSHTGSSPISISNPEAIASLWNIFTETEIQISVAGHKAKMEFRRPEGDLAVGFLGEVLMQTLDVMTRQLCERLMAPLMLTIAELYQVPSSHYFNSGFLVDEDSEIGFVNRSGIELVCELSLSGIGNLKQSFTKFDDDSNIVFVANPSESERQQIHLRRKHWIDFGAADGYKRIHTVFTFLDIPCVEFAGDLDAALDEIIPEVFEEIA